MGLSCFLTAVRSISDLKAAIAAVQRHNAEPPPKSLGMRTLAEFRRGDPSRFAAYEEKQAAFPGFEVMAEGMEHFSRGADLSSRCCLRRFTPSRGGALFFMVVNQAGGLDATEWLDRDSAAAGVVWHGTMGKPAGFGEDRVILEAGSWQKLVRLAEKRNVFAGEGGLAAAVASVVCGAPSCGRAGSLICSRCKAVRYCSAGCQTRHWRDGHKAACAAAVRPSPMEEPVCAVGAAPQR